jgi:hypothetical protein
VRYVPWAWYARREDSVVVGHAEVGKIVLEMVEYGFGVDGWVGIEGRDPATCATICLEKRIKQMKRNEKEEEGDMVMVFRGTSEGSERVKVRDLQNGAMTLTAIPESLMKQTIEINW